MSDSSNAYNMLFKIVLIGESSVGKTNILSKYLNNEFNPNSKATVGVEFGTINQTIDNNIVKIQIWDTAGQERYRSITSAYYKGAKGSLIVYDITRRSSFDSIDKWMTDLKANCDEKISVILIGNKTDLEEQREVTKEEGHQKAELYKLAFMETSALNGNNIAEAFTSLINDVYKNHHNSLENDAKLDIKDQGLNLSDDITENNNEKKHCCG